MKAVEQQGDLDQEISASGHLVVPKSAGYVNLITKHRRAGSNGTTGDESCTTDEEELIEEDKDVINLNGMIDEYVEECKEPKKKLVPYRESDEVDCAERIGYNNNYQILDPREYKNGMYGKEDYEMVRRLPQVRKPDDGLELSARHHQVGI